ncbi:universal stress protein [Kitasatospora sp. MBT63]|uniref:universal stress protein n=1 Tax=Kitasatospora sp. MBT63 TaxID=1444768 RepID=UPI00053B5CB8|nr:universal stress protein [Kitasatospora sp. MBT63]
MAEDTRVIVGVSGSLGNAAALRRAVAEAERRDAVLVPVIAWTPPGGEAAYRTRPCPPLSKLWERAAADRLDAAFARAFGGYPAHLRVEPVVIRGEAGPALVEIADRPDDLLVVGTGRRGGLRRFLHASVGRHCVARAACTVTAVPPSEAPALKAVAGQRSRVTSLAA